MKLTLKIIILTLSLNAFRQSLDCSDFKTGKFEYADPEYAELVTLRNDSLQIDSYTDMGWKITSKIEWLSDCKYRMECIEVNHAKMSTLIGKTYVIEIIEIDGNRILCQSESDGFVTKKEMIKSE